MDLSTTTSPIVDFVGLTVSAWLFGFFLVALLAFFARPSKL